MLHGIQAKAIIARGGTVITACLGHQGRWMLWARLGVGLVAVGCGSSTAPKSFTDQAPVSVETSLVPTTYYAADTLVFTLNFQSTFHNVQN
jgi:hypothetical protein